jgi:CHAT domain-containing protein/Tfp pilus assembly protein PilF
MELVLDSLASLICLTSFRTSRGRLAGALIALSLPCIFDLQPAAAQTAGMIEVTAATAPVMGGSQQIATVTRKSRYTVQGINGPWQLITVETSSGSKQGWVHRDHVRALFLPPKTPQRATVTLTPEQVEQVRSRFDRFFNAEKWPEAAQAGEQFVLMYYRGLGSEDRYTATAETLLGFCYVQLNRHYEAEQLFLHAVGVLERFPEAKDLLANALSILIDLYHQTGQYAKAEPLAAQHVRLAESLYGPDDLKTATAWKAHGAVLADLGKYEQAEALFRRALAVFERQQQAESVEEMLNNLGVTYARREQLDQALAMHQRALQLGEARLGKEHVGLTDVLYNVAKVHDAMGNYAEAERIFLRALAAIERSPRADVRKQAEVLAGLGTTQTSLGKYGEAEAALVKAVSLMETAAGADSLAAAPIHWVLGRLYHYMHRNELAEKHLQRALAIYEARVGREHRDYLHAAQQTAVVYKDLDRLDEAGRLMEELIETSKRHGESHWTLLVNLAGVRKQSGKYEEAEKLYTEALRLGEQEVGANHPQVAMALGLLAEVYLEQPEQLAKAEPLLERAIEIQQTRLGKEHPDLATKLRLLGGLYVRQGRTDEAMELFDQARRIAYIHLRRVLPALSEPEQLEYLRTQSGAMSVALSLALEHPDNRQVIEHAAEWLLNGKAVVHEVLAERTLLARSARSPELTKLAGQLQDVRKQLASQTLSTEGDPAARERALAELARREQQLQKQLGLTSGQQASADHWVELAEVRFKVPKDGVLVEIVNMHRFNYEGSPLVQTRDERYVAWIIPPAGEGQVQLVELGPEPEITGAVQVYLKSTKTVINDIADLGEAEAEASYRAVLNKIADRVLRPLEKSIAGKRQWIISPDWYLWAVPWAALPLADGRYAVEGHVISYRTSGRDLLEKSAQADAPTSMQAALFANPAFDLDPNQIARSLHASPNTVQLAMRGADVADRVPRDWSPLPGTSEEAAAVLPNLTAWLGSKPVVYEQGQALEDFFKQLKRPRALVVSTHGYCLIDEPADQPSPGARGANNDASAAAAATRIDNPLLRCGLVFSGANRRNAGTPGIDDGILTGLEIVGVDLRGTELVVLSACQTADGIISEGGGVIGLQQAFQLSGARATIATLWSIPDRETAQLMSQFWKQMAANKTKAEALQAAQLAMIQQRRTAGHAAHPFFWAAFTLTGASD